MCKKLFFYSAFWLVFGSSNIGFSQNVIIDERNKIEIITDKIEIDKVWAGHPVGFCLYTHGNHQYIAYYNEERSMVVGQRKLKEDKLIHPEWYD